MTATFTGYSDPFHRDTAETSISQTIQFEKLRKKFEKLKADLDEAQAENQRLKDAEATEKEKKDGFWSRCKDVFVKTIPGLVKAVVGFLLNKFF